MAQDIIRVLRLYSFEGPRSHVEKQIERSLKDGTNTQSAFGPFGPGEITIKVATLGTFPEIMEARSASPALDVREALAQEQADHDGEIPPYARVIPVPPWDSGPENNARIAGWTNYFKGKSRGDIPFPPDRTDLALKFEEGWDRAKDYDNEIPS